MKKIEELLAVCQTALGYEPVHLHGPWYEKEDLKKYRVNEWDVEFVAAFDPLTVYSSLTELREAQELIKRYEAREKQLEDGWREPSVLGETREEKLEKIIKDQETVIERLKDKIKMVVFRMDELELRGLC